jgi:hypothetical protein
MEGDSDFGGLKIVEHYPQPHNDSSAFLACQNVLKLAYSNAGSQKLSKTPAAASNAAGEGAYNAGGGQGGRGWGKGMGGKGR